MQLPLNKSVFLWQIKAIRNGIAADIVRGLKDMGVSTVWIKVADGANAYNLRQDKLTWKDDLVEPVVDACKRAGIGVWGWQYLYNSAPSQEAQRAIERVARFELDGFIVDAEGECKGRPTQVDLYMRLLRSSLPDLPIGVTTYRYPTLHPELPWKELLSRADFHAPQVYWAKAKNPGQQLEKCVSEYRAMEKRLRIGPLPIVPVGAAYQEHGWQPTSEEMKLFVAKVIEFGLPGYSMWEWGCAIRAGLEQTLMMLDPMKEIKPPAPVLTVEERIARLEQAAKLAGWRLD